MLLSAHFLTVTNELHLVRFRGGTSFPFELHCSLLRQSKVNKVKFYLPFSKFVKHPWTKLYADTMSDAKAIRSKRSQNLSLSQGLSLGQNFLQHSFFSLLIFYLSYNNRYWHVFATLVDILTFCDIIMLFCPLMDDWKYTMSGSTWYWCITFSVTSGDLLTLDIYLVCLDLFSSTVCCL